MVTGPKLSVFWSHLSLAKGTSVPNDEPSWWFPNGALTTILKRQVNPFQHGHWWFPELLPLGRHQKHTTMSELCLGESAKVKCCILGPNIAFIVL